MSGPVNISNSPNNQNSKQASCLTDNDLKSNSSARASAQQHNRVAYIVDSFSEKSVDINFDGKSDISHGDLVSAYAQANGTRTIKIDRDQYHGREKGYKALEKLAQSIAKGEAQPAPVNISWGNAIDIKEFGEKIGIPLTRENLATNRDKIKTRLQELKEEGDAPVMVFKKHTFFGDFPVNERPSNYLYRIEICERLTGLGCKIYHSAGNHGPDKFDPVSLAKGITTVGSLDAEGKKAEYSANNSLVKKWARGSFVPSEVKAGLDINEDGVADLQSNPRVTIKASQIKTSKPNDQLDQYIDLNKLADAIYKYAREQKLKDGRYDAVELLKLIGADKSLQKEFSGMSLVLSGINGKVFHLGSIKNEISGTSYASPIAMAKDNQSTEKDKK